MNLGTIKQAIESVVTSISGLAANNVQWRNKRRSMVNPNRTSSFTGNSEPGAQILLHIRTSRSYGRDEYTIEANGDEFVEGPRGVTLEMQCRSFTQDDDIHAVRILERVRTLIKAPSYLSVLQNADVAIASRGNVLDLSESQPVDNRAYSLAVLELELNTCARDQVPIDDASGYIESVEISGLDRTVIVEKP